VRGSFHFQFTYGYSWLLIQRVVPVLDPFNFFFSICSLRSLSSSSSHKTRRYVFVVRLNAPCKESNIGGGGTSQTATGVKRTSKQTSSAGIPVTNPRQDFDYAAAFKSLDYEALKKDLHDLQTTQEWWLRRLWSHGGGLFYLNGMAQCWHIPCSDGRWRWWWLYQACTSGTAGPTMRQFGRHVAQPGPLSRSTQTRSSWADLDPSHW